jgi:predicted DNA-binding protein
VLTDGITAQQVDMTKQYTIMLDDEQVERLKRMAETEMKTEDQLLRDIIKRYAVERGHERVFAMDGAGRGPGRSVADVPEDELMKGFGE